MLPWGSAGEESGGGQGEALQAEKGGGVLCYRDELCEAGRKPGQDRDHKPSTMDRPELGSTLGSWPRFLLGDSLYTVTWL